MLTKLRLNIPKKPKDSFIDTLQGFTLLEVLITLAIASVLFAMAAPAYRNFTMNNLMSSRINHFNSILQYARSEAVREGLPITICASKRNNTCTGAIPDISLTCCNASPADGWQSGWVLFSSDGNERTELKVGNDFSDSHQSSLIANFGGDDILSITYNTQGELANNLGRGSFTLCDSRGQTSAQSIIVNTVGRTQRAFDSDNSNIVEDHNSIDVTCP